MATIVCCFGKDKSWHAPGPEHMHITYTVHNPALCMHISDPAKLPLCVSCLSRKPEAAWTIKPLLQLHPIVVTLVQTLSHTPVCLRLI